MNRELFSSFKKMNWEIKFWIVSFFVITALHAFQWTLPLQIDALLCLANSGIYARFPNFRGIDSFLKDLLFIFHFPQMLGGWGIKSFLFQYFARIIQHVTSRPTEILFLFSVSCSLLYVFAIRRFMKHHFLSLNQSLFCLLLPLMPSVVLATRGGWQQGNANAFVVMGLTFILCSHKNYQSNLAYIFFSLLAYLTHAEAIYSLIAIGVILIIYQKIDISRMLLLNFPVFGLAFVSVVIKSPLSATDIRPDLFFQNPMAELSKFWLGARENFPIMAIWMVMLASAIWKKNKRFILAIIISTLPWCFQLVFHFAKDEAKHYLAALPILLALFWLESSIKQLRFYLIILFFSAGLGIIFSYSSYSHQFYGWNAHGQHLFYQNKLKKIIKDKEIQEILILDNKVSEMYWTLAYVYQVRRPFRFIRAVNDLKVNEVLFVGPEVKINPEGLNLIYSDPQIGMWKRKE